MSGREPLQMHALDLRGTPLVGAQNALSEEWPDRRRRLMRRYQFGPLAGIMST